MVVFRHDCSQSGKSKKLHSGHQTGYRTRSALRTTLEALVKQGKQNGHQLENLGLALLQLIHWTVIGGGRIWLRLRLLTAKISIGLSLGDPHPLDVDVDQEVQLSLH